MKKSIQVPETLYREGRATILRGADGASDSFRMSISSDTPYRRYDWMNDEEYWEVLDHGPGGMDETRLKNGLPILFNHDREKHLGRAQNYECDGHRCAVSDIKWSESQFAKEKRADAENGSLPDTSIGYTLIDDGTCVGAKDGLPIYKFKFSIHEASLVTIPADTSVGVGRQRTTEEKPALREISINSIDTKGKREQKRVAMAKPAAPTDSDNDADNLDDIPAPVIDVSRERNEAVQAERKRVSGIQELSDHFKVKGLGGRKIDATSLAEQCIREGRSVREFQDLCVRTELPEIKPIQQEALLGMNEKEKKQFSFIRAIWKLGTGKPLDGLEKEASDAAARQHGKEIGHGFYIPVDVMRSPAFPNGIQQDQIRSIGFTNEHTRALFSNIYAGAGALVGTDLLGGSLIELLRNQMMTVEMGARTLSGLKGNVAIPRQSGGATASWVAEDSTVTASQQIVGQLNLTPHTLRAATAYTEQLLIQASVDVENFVRQDLMKVIAIARDLAAINGSGVAGQPLGILNNSNLSTTVQAAGATSITYANVVAMETNVATNNADTGRLGYLATPLLRASMKITAEVAAAGSKRVWQDNMVNDYPARATNQVPTATPVIFGNWDDLILADWADTAVLVDPYSLSLQGQIRVVMRMFCDNGLRHTQSFNYALA